MVSTEQRIASIDDQRPDSIAWSLGICVGLGRHQTSNFRVNGSICEMIKKTVEFNKFAARVHKFIRRVSPKNDLYVETVFDELPNRRHEVIVPGTSVMVSLSLSAHLYASLIIAVTIPVSIFFSLFATFRSSTTTSKPALFAIFQSESLGGGRLPKSIQRLIL